MRKNTVITPALRLICLLSAVIVVATLLFCSEVEAGSKGPGRGKRENMRPEQERSILYDVVPGLQTTREKKALQSIANTRWNHASIKTLGRWLLGRQDKVYSPALQRSSAVLNLLMYLRSREKPFDSVPNGAQVARARG